MAGRILECDLGNSLCKWRLKEGVVVIGRGAAAYDNDFAALPDDPSITRARVASVASDEILSCLERRLVAMGIVPEVAVSQSEVAGVRNGYGIHAGRLGIDRWLAMVAAFNAVKGPVLVLDAGSALTADLVDGDGVHCGGYIVPGIHLMKSSLLSDTAKVRFDPDYRTEMLEFGCSTQDSVASGVLAAQVGAAKVAIEQAERRIPQGFAILVTGGAGAVLMNHLPVSARLVPELVMDGLALALP